MTPKRWYLVVALVAVALAAAGAAALTRQHKTSKISPLVIATTSSSPSPSSSASSSVAPSSKTPTPKSAAPASRATPAPTAKPGAASGSMYIAPSSGTAATGDSVSFDIRENSGSSAVNAVQANFSYPADKFDFVSISGATSAFGLQVQGSGGSGHITIVRGINPGSSTLTGDQIIATVTLKATASGVAAVTPAGGSALVRASDNANILTSTAGASFTIQ